MTLALKSTNQPRRIRHWLGRSYIFVMLLGAILIVTAYPIGDYLWVTSNYSQEVRYIDVQLFFYGMLVVIFGAVWGIIKQLVSIRAL